MYGTSAPLLIQPREMRAVRRRRRTRLRSILTDLLPNEHTAYARLDDEARDRMRRVRRPLTQNGETINHLVALTRDALNDARRTASPPPPALPSPPPSASRAAPARPSLRTGDSPAKDAPDREGRSPALKRVSFAEGSARTASPSPVRRVLRRAFARGSEPAEGAAAPDEGAAPGERAAPWWAPRARPKPASQAPASHAPLARPSRLSLTSHAPADTPLLQAQPSKAAKRRSWGFADLFPSGAPAKAPAAAAAAPAAAPTSPPAPAARSPPQLAPLQLPTSPLLETAPLSPRGRSPTPTSPRAASTSASPRKSSGAAAVPAALQIAPNRLTSPTEKSLRSVQGEGHTRSMVYPYTHGTRSGKSASPPPSSAPPTDLYEALAQHMSTHQQQQGFVAAADAARAGAGRGAQGGTSKAAAATAATATAATATDPAARSAPGPTPPPPAASAASERASGTSLAASAVPAPAARPAPPSGPRSSATEPRATRWGALFRTHAAPLPRAPLPGAEEHDVLDTSASAPAGKKGRARGAALRRLHLPASLVPSFLACAAANTAADRETCGLLLGREGDGALYVTDLVLPPQTGTSDSCTATSEEEVTALQLTEDLLTLGWIHTHPSQSCFLSSLDLHTQAGYQALLPEAVAVVCAPQHRPSLGVFRLTDPPGLRYILQCNASAPFHAHVVPGKDKDLPLYTDATNAHVRLDHARHAPPIRVRDLR